MAVTTSTRRGLVLVLYSEVLLVTGVGTFVLLPNVPALLVWGVVASAAVGLPGGLLVWAGRREFGAAHARAVAQASAVFAAMGLSLVLAFFQVTSVFPESLRLADLRGPWFFLGLSLAADVGAILLLLAPLVPANRRTWLHVTGILGLLGLLAYVPIGWRAIDRYVDLSGGLALNPAEAGSYTRDFVHDVVRLYAAALLAVRIGFWPALWSAITNVAEAEREAEAATASTEGI